MKAILCTAYGPPDVLQLQEVDKPVPKDDELLVRIYATTVTAGDVILRSMGAFQRVVFGLFFGMGKNKILGHELSGEIEAVGRGVTRFELGQPVFASAGSHGGAYAEYICLPEDGMVAAKPTNLSYEEAAAVPIGGNTALCILKKGDIRRGQKVMVYGASGSVGTYGVQLARHFGAEVTGVCSTANLEMVKSLGAAHVIDYTQEDFSQSGETFDVIFDAVGKLPASQGKAALSEGGVVLSTRSATREKPENLEYLKELAEASEIRPFIDRRYPLEQIAEAHRYVETGHKRGNVVITVVHNSQTKETSE
ncbi:MAG: NAD(P)-dependent alcohol dehydrogenase [Anaerolineae bacterium]|jgi:NADPH:quinone reductase-like Zn-dependent oxidoreductase